VVMLEAEATREWMDPLVKAALSELAANPAATRAIRAALEASLDKDYQLDQLRFELRSDLDHLKDELLLSKVGEACLRLLLPKDLADALPPLEFEKIVEETGRPEAEAEPVLPQHTAPQAFPTRPQPGRLAKIFGDNLRLARLELRLSQRELAKLSGINQKHISLIEQGVGNATLSTVDILAQHVDRTPSELLIRRPPRSR
jgi:DNA-binding XRE family transcriptional regulator